MLNRTQKEGLVTTIKADIEKANALFLTNLVGTASNEANAIRKNVRDAGGKITITRNTLLKIAAQGTYAEPLLEGLKGPHALAFSFDDAAAVAKSIKEASAENEVIDFKGGYLREKKLTAAEVLELASLPSRDQMLATLLATFNAPISAFVRVMDAIRTQKEEGAPAPAVEAAATEEAPEAVVEEAAEKPAEKEETETKNEE